MSLEDLLLLAEDMRQTILAACLKNGGHLGASLGAVELAIALHCIFDSPREPILWDVGHQAYAHKLITGRWSRFDSLRMTNGISGFLSPTESEHDLVVSGHSSTALSSALAMAWARGPAAANSGDWTSVVIGDGGFTGGLTLEALNNLQALNLGPLLLVLNDNQMSISRNVGAIPAILADGRAPAFFENFGLDYAGPLDGHDLGVLLETLSRIRQQPSGRPVLLHVLTEKGKGYYPAEERPDAYHGVSPVRAASFEKVGEQRTPSYSEAFGEALCRLAARDSKVVAVTAAMPEGTGLTRFSEQYPDRFFDVGIAEAHAVTFAAGLAVNGFRPVVAIYSSFLQRSLDSLIHDVAIQNLGVVFAIDRAGLGNDGPTHHGLFDLAYLKMIPNFRIYCPAAPTDVEVCLTKAMECKTPVAIRYPRGEGPVAFDAELVQGLRWHQCVRQPKLIVVALGATAGEAIAAVKKIDPEAQQVSLISTIEAKPLPPMLLAYLQREDKARIAVIEEGMSNGGFGESLAAALSKNRISLLGIRDHFVAHGDPKALKREERVDVDALCSQMNGLLA